jgi:uncharacterized protein
MVSRIVLTAAILCQLAVCWIAPARAASFDCRRAKAADEVAICSHPTLSALDSEMSGLWYAYSRVPMLMGENGNRHDEADAFLSKRKACGADAACLGTLYRARIKTLRGQLAAFMQRVEQEEQSPPSCPPASK